VGAAALPAASAEARPGLFGDRGLRMGMRGHDVRVLQDFLTRVGLVTPVDGRYGPYTMRRVRSWERRSARRVDGRMARSDARVLRRQVKSGTIVLQPRAPAAPAPAPATAPATDAPVAAAAAAVLGSDGLAVAPASAPAAVKATIDAANRIVGKPYRYGGGHGRWEDAGYDCSGSMSYALHGGGFLDAALTSGDFSSWGLPGEGTWITTYGSGGHSFMVVAGLRFDTGWNNSGKGPRWSTTLRPATGYTVRHPTGF
jgi:hypothetical protein